MPTYDYYDAWKTKAVSCSCGWSGTLEQAAKEYFDALIQVDCPGCDGRLALVSFPTIKQCIEAAPKLSEDERAYNAAVARSEMRFEASKLRSPEQLPELNGEALVFVWEGSREDGAETTVIRYGEQLVWREPARWDGYRRFAEVLRILKEKYGERLLDVVPAPSSEMYLYGDKIGAPGAVEARRQELRSSEGSRGDERKSQE